MWKWFQVQWFQGTLQSAEELERFLCLIPSRSFCFHFITMHEADMKGVIKMWKLKSFCLTWKEMTATLSIQSSVMLVTLCFTFFFNAIFHKVVQPWIYSSSYIIQFSLVDKPCIVNLVVCPHILSLSSASSAEEDKESRKKQVRPLFRHFRRIDACLQPREAFRGSDESEFSPQWTAFKDRWLVLSPFLIECSLLLEICNPSKGTKLLIMFFLMNILIMFFYE